MGDIEDALQDEITHRRHTLDDEPYFSLVKDVLRAVEASGHEVSMRGCHRMFVRVCKERGHEGYPTGKDSLREFITRHPELAPPYLRRG